MSTGQQSLNNSAAFKQLDLAYIFLREIDFLGHRTKNFLKVTDLWNTTVRFKTQRVCLHWQVAGKISLLELAKQREVLGLLLLMTTRTRSHVNPLGSGNRVSWLSRLQRRDKGVNPSLCCQVGSRLVAELPVSAASGCALPYPLPFPKSKYNLLTGETPTFSCSL